MRKSIGRIGVDSGQMMLVDPCYIKKSFEKDYDEQKIEKMQKEKSFSMDYNGACAATLQENLSAGVLNVIGNSDYGTAAVCSTGFGDGVYEVFVTEEEHGGWGKRISKMEIVFIDEDDEQGW